MALQKWIPTKIESSETSGVFIRGKRFRVDRHRGRLRERITSSWCLNHLYGHFFPMSFGQSFCFAWFWVCIWYISGSSCVLAHLSARTDLAKRFMSSLASLPFWLPRSRQVGKVSLALRMTNMWSLIFYLGRAQPLQLSCFMAFLSIGNELYLLSLGPIYLLP